MTSQGSDAPDLRAFLSHLLAGSSADASASRSGETGLEYLWRRPEPQLHPIPDTTRGFRIRVDLQRTKPPVWRRIDVPGDITLPRLHDVLQDAMGWTDSHLHRFRTGFDRNAAEFLTQFDLDEGDEGMLEDGVRLDQVVAAVGDRLWYDYDFGDGWGHLLRVEQVLETPPTEVRCIAGRLACPPEDCGGTWGYAQLAAWVRSDYDEALRPEIFDSTAEARRWLPDGWHPDVFDLEEVNEQLAARTAQAAPVTAELASLVELEQRRGARGLRRLLSRRASRGPTETAVADATRLTEPFRVLLDEIGDGVALTAAGYLPPARVEAIAQRTGVTQWWMGKANREDLTWPVANLRAAARALGLVTVRHGRLTPTRAARAAEADPVRLLTFIANRLPVGTHPAERQFGWAALVAAGSDTPIEQWDAIIADAMFDLGWRDPDSHDFPPADSPTLTVLHVLAGAARTGPELHGIDTALAGAARAAVRP